MITLYMLTYADIKDDSFFITACLALDLVIYCFGIIAVLSLAFN